MFLWCLEKGDSIKKKLLKNLRLGRIRCKNQQYLSKIKLQAFLQYIEFRFRSGVRQGCSPPPLCPMTISNWGGGVTRMVLSDQGMVVRQRGEPSWAKIGPRWGNGAIFGCFWPFVVILAFLGPLLASFFVTFGVFFCRNLAHSHHLYSNHFG